MQFNMEITNICDLKRLVIQIDSIANLVQGRVRLEHIGGFWCGRLLRVRLEHISSFPRTVYCFTQHGQYLLIFGKLTEIVQQTAVTVTNILTLGIGFAVRHENRKHGFIITGILIRGVIPRVAGVLQ